MGAKDPPPPPPLFPYCPILAMMLPDPVTLFVWTQYSLFVTLELNLWLHNVLCIVSFVNKAFVFRVCWARGGSLLVL